MPKTAPAEAKEGPSIQADAKTADLGNIAAGKDIAQLQAAHQEIEPALGEDLMALRQSLLDETKEQVASMTQASLQSLSEAITEHARKQSTQWLREQAQIDRQNADAAVHSINLAAKEAIAQLRTAQQEIEASLKRLAEGHGKQFTELSSAMKGLPGGLQELQEKTRIGVVNELEKAAKDLLKHSDRQLRGQADATVAALGEELRALRQRFLDETRAQVACMTESSLQSFSEGITRQARKQSAQWLGEQAEMDRRNADAAVHSINLATKEAIAQLQAAKQEMEASFKRLAEEHRKRLAELSCVIEGLAGALQGLHQRIREEAANELEKAAKDLLSR